MKETDAGSADIRTAKFFGKGGIAMFNRNTSFDKERKRAEKSARRFAKKNKREGLLERMDSFLSEAVVPSASDPTEPEETELPFESLDDYSTDPIGFEEIADMVCTKVKAFFSLSVKYNHRSSKYLEACGFLERGIKYLGSCCLTGVLLKKKGHELPKLEDLSTHWLYGMVSFNIRKLNRTVDEELATA